MVIPLLAALTALSSAALAADASQIQATVTALITNRHPSPEDVGVWKGLGPQAPAVIMDMYRQARDIEARERLLQGLGWYDSPEVADFLKQAAAGTDEGVIRNASLGALGRSAGEGALDFEAGFLNHADPDTRFAAAEAVLALELGGSDRAKALLADYESRERTGWIKRRIEKDRERDGEPGGGALVGNPGTPAERVAEPGEALLPSGVSGHPLAERFAGKWVGQAVVPAEFWSRWSKGAAPKDLGTAPVELELLNEHVSGAWKGKGTLGKATLEIQEGRLNRDSLSGSLKVGAEVFSYEARWRQREGISFLELEIPRLATWGVLRSKGR
ncbi:MAG TPA: HEAT repeat domain-containing protein [Bdellovibrionota bacterium]|jgi:hypothetical protein|nr:HEAT repeat domain-containing protein [Bdellovibrionota bacterium]